MKKSICLIIGIVMINTGFAQTDIGFKTGMAFSKIYHYEYINGVQFSGTINFGPFASVGLYGKVIYKKSGEHSDKEKIENISPIDIGGIYGLGMRYDLGAGSIIFDISRLLNSLSGQVCEYLGCKCQEPRSIGKCIRKIIREKTSEP